MKQNTNFHALATAVILIMAGIFSASNFVNEKSSKTPGELLMTMFVIVVVVFLAYLFGCLLSSEKEVVNEYHHQNNEDDLPE